MYLSYYRPVIKPSIEIQVEFTRNKIKKYFNEYFSDQNFSFKNVLIVYQISYYYIRINKCYVPQLNKTKTGSREFRVGTYVNQLSFVSSNF